MDISAEARIMIGISMISLPTIAFGGYFLLSQLKRATVITSDKMGAYYRAGHAHAGVLVLLAMISQLVIDTLAVSSGVAWALRLGFFAAPLLISGGFFGGAPVQGDQPRPLIRLVVVGAVVLTVTTLATGVLLIFGGDPVA
jgi:hypothetical protein